MKPDQNEALAPGSESRRLFPVKTYAVAESGRELQVIAEEALREPVMLILGARLLIVQEYEAPEPIPVRPLGFFDAGDEPDQAAWENSLTASATTELLE